MPFMVLKKAAHWYMHPITSPGQQQGKVEDAHTFIASCFSGPEFKTMKRGARRTHVRSVLA